MIDFHCHLDLYPDPVSITRRVDAEGMYLLAVTTTPRAWQGTCSVVAGVRRIKVALGLHPELVAERHSEISLFRELLDDASYVGEIGLDGSAKLKSTLPLQRRVLEEILVACAQKGGRIMSVHSRNAASDVLDVLGDSLRAGTPVLHWFSGTLKELERAVECGCWFSVGMAMLTGQKGQKLVAAMPRERILTETDGPFVRGKSGPMMPWDVPEAESALGRLWNESPEAVTSILLGNLRQLVSRHSHNGAA